MVSKTSTKTTHFLSHTIPKARNLIALFVISSQQNSVFVIFLGFSLLNQHSMYLSRLTWKELGATLTVLLFRVSDSFFYKSIHQIQYRRGNIGEEKDGSIRG